jgi:hypothetical protein
VFVAFLAFTVGAQVPGNTQEEKLEFLRNLSRERATSGDSPDIQRRYREALEDPFPLVRQIAVGGIGDFDVLIDVMNADPAPSVRNAAALQIGSFITSNGVVPCIGVETISSRLPEILEAIRNGATFQALVETLAGRESGDTFLVCCMASREREQVASALQALIVEPPERTQYWTVNLAPEALKHLEACGQ